MRRVKTSGGNIAPRFKLRAIVGIMYGLKSNTFKPAFFPSKKATGRSAVVILQHSGPSPEPQVQERDLR
jgi:hypothetical protein